MATKKEENTEEEATQTSPDATLSDETEKGVDKPETILVEKSVLEKVLLKMTELETQADISKKEIERLEFAADVGRLQAFDSKNVSGLIRTAQVATMEHEGVRRIVLGWKATKDYVRFENDVLKETQIAEYWLEPDADAPLDGDGNKVPIKIEVPQRHWYLEIQRIVGDIIRESVTPDGQATKVLRFADGKELEFDVVFLNP